MIAAIALKDLRVLFRSPLTWLALAILQAVFAWLFLLGLEEWLQIQTQRATRSAGATAWLIDRCFAPASTLLIAVAPLLTMRLIADERRGTGIELLLSAPLAPWRLICGKLAAALAVYFVLLLPLGAMILALLPFTAVDLGTLGSALLGLTLLSLSCCTIGVFFSGLSRQAAVAALASFGALFLLWIVGAAKGSAVESDGALTWLSLASHTQPLLRGLLRIEDLVYFSAISAMFIVLSIRHLDNVRRASPTMRGERMRQTLFVCVVLAITAWLGVMSTRYSAQFDLTAQSRHSLSAPSVAAVQALAGPLKVDAWLEPHARTRDAIANAVERYRQHKHDINLEFFNPQTQPSQAREKGIQPGGELILQYNGREQRIAALDEQAITHALLRLLHTRAPTVRFVSGHLERQPESASRHGYQQFTGHLRTLGFSVDTISLITTPTVPAGTDLLVIAAPSGGYFPGESASILNYLAANGNLLWLIEPGQPTVPAELAAELGLSVLPGVVVDVASQQLAVDTPDFAVIDRYPAHPAIPRNLPVTLFPQAAGLEFPATVGWQVEAILTTGDSSWTETGQLTGTISHDADAGERAGPITLGATFTRQRGEHEQRLIVIGDADFLANGWLGNGGNKFLGQQLFNWLSGQASLPAIAPLQAADAQIIMSKQAIAVIGIGFLVVLPCGFVIMALLSWRRRTA